MKTIWVFSVILLSLIGSAIVVACSPVEDVVKSAARLPASPPSLTPSPITTVSPSGYLISSGGGAYLQGSTYKWRVRVGKLEASTSLNGTTHKIRTGRIGQIHDL